MFQKTLCVSCVKMNAVNVFVEELNYTVEKYTLCS